MAMLETIREFATERLVALPNGEGVRREHARFFTTFVEDAQAHLTAPDQVEWWARLTAEEPNIRAALGWATSGGNAELGLRLSAAMWRYWWQRGQYREGRGWFEAALAQAPDAPDALRIPVVYGLANMAMGMGRDEEAVRLLDECLRWYRAAGDTAHAIWALTDIGIVHARAGRVDESRAASLEALSLASEAGHDRYQGVISINLANSYLATREWDRAKDWLRRALVHFGADDQSSKANALENLAVAELGAGRLAEAEDALTESIVQSRMTDDRLTLLHSVMTASAILLARGDAATATRMLAFATRLRDEREVTLDVAEARLAEDTLEQLRSGLPRAEFAASWDAGAALPYDQALDEVLSALRPSAVAASPD
jgi:tetratricopeptide (TPR) repeat protein